MPSSSSSLPSECAFGTVIYWQVLFHYHLSSFDIHMSVHRRVIPNYSQQNATFLLGLFISTDALHVSGGSSAHHQEHITVHTAPGIVNQYYCLLLSWRRWGIVLICFGAVASKQINTIPHLLHDSSKQ